MRYHEKQHQREKLPILGLPSLEKTSQKNLKAALFAQTEATVTDRLLEEASARWRMLKRKTQEQSVFEMYIHERVRKSYAMQGNSTFSAEIMRVLYEAYLLSLAKGVTHAKRQLIAMLMATKEQRFAPIVQQTKMADFHLTNEKILYTVQNGSHVLDWDVEIV